MIYKRFKYKRQQGISYFYKGDKMSKKKEKNFTIYNTDHGMIDYDKIIEIAESNIDGTIEIEGEKFDARFLKEESVICHKNDYKKFTAIIMVYVCISLLFPLINAELYIILIALVSGAILIVIYAEISCKKLEKKEDDFIMKNSEAYRKLGHVCNKKIFDHSVDMVLAGQRA
jgi:uncharacterized membrane protein YjjP (DUF1212 family)